MSVLLGNGDGTFQPQVTYAVGSDPIAIVAGDFNGDGHLDLAVANDVDSTVSVLLGNGDGTFQPAVSYAVGDAPAPSWRATSTATAGSTWPSPTLGSTDGVGAAGQRRRHVPAPGHATRSGRVRTSIVAGDFNGDGRLDLAVANDSGSSTMSRSCWAMATARSRPERHRTRSGSSPDAIVAGDFNGDGQLDLAVANDGSDDGVGAAGQRRRHVPAPGRRYAVGTSPDAIVAGDFNGDGRLDLAVANCGRRHGVGAAGQRRRHLPAPGRPTRSGPDPDAIVAGDFNGDGRLDLAVVNDSDGVRRRVGAAGQRRRHLPARGRPTRSGPGRRIAIVAGDFNGDGQLDLAVARQLATTRRCRSCWATATAPSSPRSTLRGRAESPTGIVAGDFNGDGQLDLAVANDLDDGTRVGVAGQRRRHVPAPGHLPGRGRIRSRIVAGDFNGDGQLDLAVANGYSRRRPCRCLLGNGDGTFQPQVTTRSGRDPDAIVAGDFTGDGQPRPGRRRLSGQRRRRCCWATATARSSTPASSPPRPHATPLVADVNGDGTDDVLVVDGAGDILYRQGIPGQPGSFVPPVTVNPGSPSRDIAWVPETDRRPAARQRRRPGRRRLALRLPRRPLRPRSARSRPASSRRRSSRPTSTATAWTTWSSAMPATARSRSTSAAGPERVCRPERHARSPNLPAAFTLPVGPGVSDVQAVDTTGQRPCSTWSSPTS